MSIRGGFMTRMQSKQEDFSLSAISRQSLEFIWMYLKRHLGRMGLALLATLAGAAISLTLPYLVKLIVDDAIANQDMTGLTLLALIYLALVGLQWFAFYWQGYLSSWVGQHIVDSMRQDLFAKITDQSLGFHEKQQVGQITARITHDINAIASFISDGAVNLLADVVVVLGIIMIMAVINVRLTLITLISLPVALLSIRYLGNKMRTAYWEVQQALADVNTGIEQGIAGMRVVKSLARESFTMEKFEQLSMQNMKANLKTSLLFAAVFPTMTITNMLGIALVLGYGGTLITEGQMTVGVLMAFLAYVYRLFGPLRDLGLVYGTIQAAAASVDRVLEIMRQETELPEPKSPITPQKGFRGEIQVDDISFSYDDDPVLNEISFQVAAGQSIAIVGPTGAGKSTLAKLLTRLYDVDQGAVRIDGIDVRDIPINKLRQLITIVPQDVFLFADTIFENIRYGNPQADAAAVEFAAKQAQAHSFINQLPNGYYTQVGELGVKLSGGQKQLIAFARTLLADPKILILDEATANVDPITESLIQKAMSTIAHNRTTLIIAHRFSTLSQVSKTLVLDKGKLVGYDTHEKLIAENDVYRKLYQQHINYS